MKEYQSFHKIRSSGKLAKLGNMAPGKAGLISKVDKKDAPNLKNEKLSSRATKPNGKSIKSDRSAADKHGVVHAKEKKELLKFLNEKLSQKRAKSDGKLKKASVKEFSKTRHVRTGEYCNGSLGILGLYSLSSKTSYRKISWSLEAARFGFKHFQSLWNLTGPSAAVLPRCLSHFRAILSL